MDERRYRKLAWVLLPATVPRNFDANGSPCDEPGVVSHATLRAVLYTPVEYIQLRLELS